MFAAIKGVLLGLLDSFRLWSPHSCSRLFTTDTIQPENYETPTSPPSNDSNNSLSTENSRSTLCIGRLEMGPTIHIPHQCIHHAVSVHVRSRPQDDAVVTHTGNALTYGELDRLSANLAMVLRSRGVQRGTRVCLLVERSIAQIIAILAVLRAGAAYVPLDGAVITDVSLDMVLEDVQPALTLVSERFMARGTNTSYGFDCLEGMILVASASQSLSPDIQNDVESSDCAYVIYTSGTTGRPKGVKVSHLNVTNLLCLTPGNLGITAGIRVAQLLNIGFDMCVWETLGCLMNGGTLYLRGPRRADWIKVLQTVDVVISTPSILSQHDPHDFPNIRVVATAGEPCPQLLADRWSEHATFYNCCGPTEVTIVNTMHRHVAGMPLSIGRPTPNNMVYLLDDKLQPVPRGSPGVMWAAGLGICMGYLNRPDLDAAKFAKDPFSTSSGRMYNTGDIGRWREDEEVEHLGRLDEQVKIKGFRVELDGVAASMCSCPGVEAACALLVDGQLWGFYTPSEVSQESVRAATATVLPYYAVPDNLRGLQNLPLTPNGKVDKQILRRQMTD